jgi:hypothetical protein
MAVKLEDIQKSIDAINKSLNSNQGKITADAKEYVKQFKSAEQAAKNLELTMRGIRQEQLEMSTGLNELRDRFADIGKELNNQDKIYKTLNKSFDKLVNYADDLSDIQYDLAASTLKETKGLQSKVNLEFQRLKTNAKYLRQQISSGKLQGEELAKAQELLAFAEDEVKTLEEKVGYQNDFNNAIDETYKRQKRVHNAVGLTGKLIGGLGGLLEKVGFEDFGEEINHAKEKMGALAVELTNNGEKAAGFVGTMKVGLTGLASIGKSVLSALSDPLVVFGLMHKAVHGLIDLSKEFTSNVAKTGIGFGVAGKEAEHMYHGLEKAASMYYLPEELVENSIKASDALGMVLNPLSKFSQENAKVMQDLTTRLGYSEEAAGSLIRISTALGKNFKVIDKNVTSTVNSFNKQNKTGVSLKKVMETIAGASASTRFNITGGEKGLAKAASVAAKYGKSMDEIANSAKSLLNFEDSISNELEAELLLGKDLNLERLRYSALTGDTETTLKEQEKLVRQNFKNLKGNVIAQEAFAKSIGMSVEDVAKMAEQQEIMSKMSPKQLKQHQDQLEAQADLAKESESFDRSLKAAAMEMKKALLPLVQAITPLFVKMANAIGTIGKSLSGETGKMILKIVGIAAGGVIAGKAAMGIKNLFSGVGGGGGMVGGDQPGTAKKGLLSKVFGGKGNLGESASNPMYVYVVNQSGGGGAEDMLGDMLDGKKGGSLGKAPKASFLKKLKNPKTMLKALARQGGASGGSIGFKSLGKGLLKSGGKSLLKGAAGGIGGLLGGVALDMAASSQFEESQKLSEQAKKISDPKKKKQLEEKAKKAKMRGKTADVGSSALTGAGLGASIGSIIPGVGTVVGGALGGAIGAGYGLFSNWESEPEQKKSIKKAAQSRPRPSQSSSSSKSSASSGDTHKKLDELISAVKQSGNVYLNGTKVGTAMAVNTYKTQ